MCTLYQSRSLIKKEIAVSLLLQKVLPPYCPDFSDNFRIFIHILSNLWESSWAREREIVINVELMESFNQAFLENVLQLQLFLDTIRETIEYYAQFQIYRLWKQQINVFKCNVSRVGFESWIWSTELQQFELLWYYFTYLPANWNLLPYTLTLYSYLLQSSKS